MSTLGLDFGTTNSVLAAFVGSGTEVISIDEPPHDWAQLGFDRVLPSVLGVHQGQEVTFGWLAKRQAGSKLEAVKRLFAVEDVVQIDGKDFSVEMAAALLFARIKAGAEAVGMTMERAVVTIPANSRGLARFRTKLCAGLAGIEVPALINEPTAAAMAHSIEIKNDQTILVFDWGGGTLDVTLLETAAGVFIERASKGIQRSGGIDLDALFAADVSGLAGSQATSWTSEQRSEFRLEVEKAKVILSDQVETNLRLPGGSFIPVSRAVLERSIRSKIEETRRPIDQCLADARISRDAIDHVVMVGGSSKIPAVRQFVSEIMGQEPASGCDPMTAVAEGAAIAAAILGGQLDNDFFVSTEHALGTIVLDGGTDKFSTLIPRNHMLPAKEVGSYHPIHEGQDSVLIRVIEGDPDVALNHPDNVILKEWEIQVDPTRPLPDAGFNMFYEYDVDGILRVTVVDQKTEKVMLHDDVSFGVSRDKSGLVTIAKSVRETLATGRLPDAYATGGPARSAGSDGGALTPDVTALIERVRAKILPFIDDEEVRRLESIIADLENSTGEAVAPCRLLLDAESKKYAYLF